MCIIAFLYIIASVTGVHQLKQHKDNKTNFETNVQKKNQEAVEQWFKIISVSVDKRGELKVKKHPRAFIGVKQRWMLRVLHEILLKQSQGIATQSSR